MKPKLIGKGLNFRVTKQSFYSINDPALANHLRISIVELGKEMFGPSGNGTFTGGLVEIQINVEDSRLFIFLLSFLPFLICKMFWVFPVL